MESTNPKELIIEVSDVNVNSELFSTAPKEQLLFKQFATKTEASSLDDILYLQSYEAGYTNSFLDMLGRAFFNHKPVIITPDNIWLLICHGFAEHIKKEALYFRKKIVAHEGQETIKVEIHSFIKGGENPWEDIFPLFEEKIKKYLKEDLHSKLVQNFSTTTLKERTAYQIAFMDAVSKYFKYEGVSMCGIPKIKLTGSVLDYENMLISLDYLKSYKLDWWINPLVKIINKIIDTLKGNIDSEFWQSIYHVNSMSGKPNSITGWISNFFPYVKNTKFWHIKPGLVKNPHIFGKKKLLEDTDFPSGISKVPFLWRYYGLEYKMHFIAGFIGITENKNDNFLETKINWIIQDE
jgi:hypothetical protein